MLRPLRARDARALSAAALVAVSLSLTACVSDSPGRVTPGAAAAPTTVPGASATVAPAPTVAPIDRSKPVAVVGGTPITGAAYADAVAQQRKSLAQQVAQQPGMQVPSEQQLRSASLNGLIDREVAKLYARQHGISVTAAQVQKQYDAVQVRYGGPITFTKTLQSYGFTPPSFHAWMADRMIESQVQQRVAPLATSVDAVRARHILVKTRALAEKLYAQLKADPRSFPALAKKYSIDTGSGSQGGELGLFPHGAMVPSFDQAAFAQKVGQIGAPVQSQYGYHIIQVEEHRLVPLTAFSAQMQQQVQQTLAQRQQAVFQHWMAAERKRDHVRVLIPGIAGA